MLVDPHTDQILTEQLIAIRDAGGTPVMLITRPTTTFVGLDGDSLIQLSTAAVGFDAAQGIHLPPEAS